MESTEQPITLTDDQIGQLQSWWATLSDPWKHALNEVMLRRSTIDMPGPDELYQIQQCQTLRMAGPTAPYPNMTQELEDLSGIRDLPNLSILIVVFHKLSGITELSNPNQITSLFLHNNQITSLEGLEAMVNLQEIYFNVNQVHSLQPLANLTNLHTVYCNYNLISSLAGIGIQHQPKLKNFICLPNDLLPESEVIMMERETGIRCKKG